MSAVIALLPLLFTQLSQAVRIVAAVLAVPLVVVLADRLVVDVGIVHECGMTLTGNVLFVTHAFLLLAMRLKYFTGLYFYVNTFYCIYKMKRRPPKRAPGGNLDV